MPTGKEGEMLLGHNEPVYKNLCETLEKHKKAIVVTFTGGGKSFLASEYLAESGLHALVVCPKRTICSQWAALNQSVDTMTYSAFAKVPLEDLLRYEAVILDEAHHCGSRVWGARAKELTENTAGVVIGLTADSVRWSDGGKDVAQELFDGHIVKGYSLQEAIEQNIVRPFSYVCTIIGFNRMIQERVERLSNGKLDARLRAKAEHLIARLKLDAEAAASVTDVLRQYMPANPKGIVFTDDIAAIEEARGLMNEAFPDMSCYTIHSKQSKEKNEAQLAAFMQAPTACIISVNMLGEGVHVDGVNFIVMLRRTQSPTVYFQQIGRCTKVGSDGEPVIFDIVLYAVCLNAAEKRIPVQYAGKNGNRGAGSFIPVRLVTGGVMPVIFAGSVLGIPSMISLFVSGEKHPSLYRALTAFARGNWLYILLYAVLIFAFHRFYLAIQFDSTEIATNLRKRGGMIPGVRPGKPTADYLNRAIKGMADSGSLALVLVACLPMLLSKAFGISLQLGGTSLLIVVGVAIELAGQVDSQLTIRHHDGFLD